VERYIPRNDETAKSYAKTVFYWIKAWFFVVETEAEYKHSKESMFKWIDKNDIILQEPFIKAVKDYIREKLEPYDVLWLNYVRLDVLGMDVKTTSIGEAMHHSMKSGASGVRPSMNVAVSANVMMDRAQSHGRKKAVSAAAQVNRTPVWSSDSETSQDLTKYCEGTSMNDWESRVQCLVFESAPGKYLVLTPGKVF
jgi:hypothetical protein